jgi:hypothetical protein
LDNLIGQNGVTNTGVLIDRRGNRYQISFGGPCRSTKTDNGFPGDFTTTTICTEYSGTSNVTDINGNIFDSTGPNNTFLTLWASLLPVT